jgi:hypothetical protein
VPANGQETQATISVWLERDNTDTLDSLKEDTAAATMKTLNIYDTQSEE